MMMFDLSPINQHFGDKDFDLQLSRLAFNRFSQSSAIMPSLSLIIDNDLKKFSIIDQSKSMSITIDDQGYVTSNNLRDNTGFVVQGRIHHPGAIHHTIRQFISALHTDKLKSDMKWFEYFIHHCNLKPSTKDMSLDVLLKMNDDQLAPLKRFFIKHPIVANVLLGLPIGSLLYATHILTATTALLSVFSINALNEHLSNEADKLQPTLGDQIAGLQRDAAIRNQVNSIDDAKTPTTAVACR